MTHHRGRHSRHGSPGGPFAFGGPGPGPGPGRGPRARRGDVRAGILALLAEEPRNGYQIIQELESRSGGVWRPSPGSIYPALAQLEDEGLVSTTEVEGRRAYALTDAGRKAATEREDDRAPWDTLSDSVSTGVTELRDITWQLGAALMQLAHAGTEAQISEAKRIVSDARKAIYRILAEDAPSE
jgi:DNA-binding PadR family transcriptional regulator